jgi:hypothetical protein
MAEGEGGELGTVSLSESSEHIGGSSCMILGGCKTEGYSYHPRPKRRNFVYICGSSSESRRWFDGREAPCSVSV